MEDIKQDSQDDQRSVPFEWRNNNDLREEFNRILDGKSFEGFEFPGWVDDGVPTTFQAILGLWNEEYFERESLIYSQMDVTLNADPIVQTDEIRASGVSESMVDLETENALLSIMDNNSEDDSDDFINDDDIDALLAEIQTPLLLETKKELHSAQTPIRKFPIENSSLEEGSLAAYYSMTNMWDDSLIEEKDSGNYIPQLDGAYDEAVEIDVCDFSTTFSKNSKPYKSPQDLSKQTSTHLSKNVHPNESKLHFQTQVIYTEPFYSNPIDLPLNTHSLAADNSNTTKWTLRKVPPPVDIVKAWKDRNSRNVLGRTVSFLEGPTQNSDKGIKRSQPLSEKSQHKKNYLTLLGLEAHGNFVICC